MTDLAEAARRLLDALDNADDFDSPEISFARNQLADALEGKPIARVQLVKQSRFDRYAVPIVAFVIGVALGSVRCALKAVIGP